MSSECGSYETECIFAVLFNLRGWFGQHLEHAQPTSLPAHYLERHEDQEDMII